MQCTCMLQNSMGKPVRASLRHELLGGARESGVCRSRRGVETDRRHCQGDGVRHPALVDDRLGDLVVKGLEQHM